MKPLLLLFCALGSAMAALAEPPRTVVCFGDSITAGGSLPTAEKPFVWPALVEKWANGKLRIINEGKGGRPTNSLKEFEEMLKRQPQVDVLVIALGGNDARDITDQCVPKAVRNLRAMMARAREAYGPKLTLLLVGPTNIRKDALGPTRPIADQRDAKLRELNAAFADLAKEAKCQFLSLYGVVPETSLGRDGVHPDRAGNEIIARTLLPSILSAAKP